MQFIKHFKEVKAVKALLLLALNLSIFFDLVLLLDNLVIENLFKLKFFVKHVL